MLDQDISQRHLSFVESGRSAPSREFLSIVSDALNIPLRERNVLLLASGYAEAGVRRILGMLSLAKKYGSAACDQACAAALEIGVV